MKEKSLPTWSVVAAIAAAIALVGVLFFAKGGVSMGDGASRDELLQMRQTQDHRSTPPANPQ